MNRPQTRQGTPIARDPQGARPQAHKAQVQPGVPMATPAGAPAGAPAGTPQAAAPDKQKTVRRTVLIVLGVVVVAVVIWLLVWLFACNGSSLFDPTARDGQAPYKTDEEIQAELDRVVEEGMFNISIASVIQFDGSDSSGTAYIENVPGNRYNMKVAITDDDTGETVYESGVLKPNQYIEKITLTHDLEPGMHEATALFTALDPDTNEETGKAAAKVTLNVLE